MTSTRTRQLVLTPFWDTLSTASTQVFFDVPVWVVKWTDVLISPGAEGLTPEIARNDTRDKRRQSSKVIADV